MVRVQVTLDLLSLGLLPFTFSLIFLIAGDGVLPIGLFFILGLVKIIDNPSVWDIPMIILIPIIAIMIGVALQFASIFIYSKRFYLWVSAAALMVLVVCWCSFIVFVFTATVEDGVGTLASSIFTFIITSIPF